MIRKFLLIHFIFFFITLNAFSRDPLTDPDNRYIIIQGKALVDKASATVPGETVTYTAGFLYPSETNDIHWVVPSDVVIVSQNTNPANGPIYITVTWGQTEGYITINEGAATHQGSIYTTSSLYVRFHSGNDLKILPLNQYVNFNQQPCVFTAEKQPSKYPNGTPIPTYPNSIISYSYQWQFVDLSTGNWNTVASGGTNNYYQPTVVNTSYRVIVTVTIKDANSGATLNTIILTSGAAAVISYDANPGKLIASSSYVSYNTQVTGINDEMPYGGGCQSSNYIYSWEVSYNGNMWQTFGSSLHYPGGITASKKNIRIRRAVRCGASQFIYTTLLEFTMTNNSLVEDGLNYIRENTILTKGIESLEESDQLQTGARLQNTVYFDGFNSPIQKVKRELGTPLSTNPNVWQDIVTPITYDGAGRQGQQFLPYASTVNTGKYRSDPFTPQALYYQQNFNESVSYSKNEFEANPLSRVTNFKAPGISWANSQGNSMIYELNDPEESVRYWTVGYNETDIPQSPYAYPALTLFRKTNKDDKNRRVIEYTNNEGQIILKKVQVDDYPSVAHSGWMCTYFVYDDYGLLRYELQPEAVKWLENNNWSFGIINGQTALAGYCFKYGYDSKKRMILKKSPGVAELYMIYDKRDRLAFTQDGNQRLKVPAQWTAYLYDDLDRPVITALYATTQSRTVISGNALVANTTSPVTTVTAGEAVIDLIVNKRVGNLSVYSAQNSITFAANGGGNFQSSINDDFTTQITPGILRDPTIVGSIVSQNVITPAELNDPAVTTIVKYFFYDDYTYNGAKSFNTNFRNNGSLSGDPIATSKRTMGMQTGTRVRVLGTNIFLTNTFYFDEKGRNIQSTEENIKDGQEIITRQYHFNGTVLDVDINHSTSNSGYDNFSFVTSYSFDKIWRVTGIYKVLGVNDQIGKLIATYDYDDMGRLKTKHLDPWHNNTDNLYNGKYGQSDIETLNYDYTVQGQLTGINKDYALKTPGKYTVTDHFFGMSIGYDDRDNLFANKLLDGHITGTIWGSQGNDAQRRYDFTYDNAGRLSGAAFIEKPKIGDSWANTRMDFSVLGNNGAGSKIDYDLNGNLLHMTQRGVLTGSTAPVDIDKLSYSYESLGNKLLKVRDNSNIGTANGKLGDFSDGSNGDADDYNYDDNGNLQVDLNKGISTGGINGKAISYNFLDKPENITIPGKGVLKIVYDADGNKVQKKFTSEGSQIVVTTTYVGNLVYKEDDVQYVNFEEGRVRLATWTYSNNGYDIVSIQDGTPMPVNRIGIYDFFIRDNLGNVRAVLTDESHSASSKCSMEPGRSAVEESIFGKVDANGNATSDNEVKARFPIANIPGQGNGNGWQSNTSSYVSRLGNLIGQKIGPNVLLKVMAGDYIDTYAQAFYKNPVSNQNNGSSLVNDVVLSLVQAISGSSFTGNAHGGTSFPDLTSQLTNDVPFKSIVDPDASNNNGTAPKAYLSVLFFDDQFNFITPVNPYDNKQRVWNNPGSNSNNNLRVESYAKQNGYAFVYVSNSSDETVYFDDLVASIKHSPLLEENHYYPFGAKIASISSRKMGDLNEGALKNPFQYQGDFSEVQDETAWNEFELRNYDAQIGRFVQNDPYDQFASGFVGMGNDPVSLPDPSGGWVFSEVGLIEHGLWTVAGATAGAIIARATSGPNQQSIENGALIGAGIGLGASFVNWGAVGNWMGNTWNSINWGGLRGYGNLLANLYNTRDEAAEAWSKEYGADAVKNAVEKSSNIYQYDKEFKDKKTKKITIVTKYFYNPAETDPDDNTGFSPGPGEMKARVPHGSKLVGHIHDHPDDRDVHNLNFSRPTPGYPRPKKGHYDTDFWKLYPTVDFYLLNYHGVLQVSRGDYRYEGTPIDRNDPEIPIERGLLKGQTPFRIPGAFNARFIP